uniref:Uncharacterized protein n=1 Tax=viral metagenome TaxID=1070528 RepID=A0A6H1ZJA7_9ZZZZ
MSAAVSFDYYKIAPNFYELVSQAIKKDKNLLILFDVPRHIIKDEIELLFNSINGVYLAFYKAGEKGKEYIGVGGFVNFKANRGGPELFLYVPKEFFEEAFRVILTWFFKNHSTWDNVYMTRFEEDVLNDVIERGMIKVTQHEGDPVFMLGKYNNTNRYIINRNDVLI